MTDDEKPMGRGELERIGRTVWGETWKADLTEHFAIKRQTVGHWVRDDVVPAWAAEQLRAMVRFPPAPRDVPEDEAYQTGAGLVAQRLEDLLTQACGAGWQYQDVLDMVADWLDAKDAPHQHQGGATPL